MKGLSPNLPIFSSSSTEMHLFVMHSGIKALEDFCKSLFVCLEISIFCKSPRGPWMRSTCYLTEFEICLMHQFVQRRTKSAKTSAAKH